MKRRKNRMIAAMLVVCLGALSMPGISAKAYNGKSEKILSVPNVEGCSNLGAMVMVGKKAFALKTNPEDTKSVLYTFKDYTKQSYTTKTLTGLGHGNSLSWHTPAFSVATMEEGIVRLNSKGEKIGTYKTPNRVYNIAHLGNEVFIVRSFNGKNVKGYISYCLGKFNEKTKTFDVTSGFYVKDTGLATKQDIYCISGQTLLIPSCDVPGVKNEILMVDLKGSYTMMNGLKTYEPYNKITINPSKDKYRKFEVESVCKNSAGEIFYCANIERWTDSSKQSAKSDDGIYQITNFKK